MMRMVMRDQEYFLNRTYYFFLYSFQMLYDSTYFAQEVEHVHRIILFSALGQE